MLYSTGCPKCKILEKKLEMLGKEFTVISDLDMVLAVAEQNNIQEAPFVSVDGEIYNFTETIKALNEGRF